MTATFERHPIDLSALVFGVTFQVVGLAALAQDVGWIDLSGRTWLGVVVLAVGVAGLVGVLGSVLRASARHAAATAVTSATSPPESPAPDRR
jgi:hypothetical protein